MKFRHKKVVIWGWPLYGDTFGYIFHGLYRGFKELGIEVHWIDPTQGWAYEPTTLASLSDCLVIGEVHGSIQNHLPLDPSSTYMIHNVGNKPGGPMDYGGAQNYIDKVRRFIDWRCCPMYSWDDSIYSFEIDNNKMPWIGPGSRFQKADNTENYDKIYTCWATNLLPSEINFDDRFVKREKVSWWVGNIGGGQGGLDDCNESPAHGDNRPMLREFKRACEDAGVEFKSNCPWKNPLSFEQQKELAQKSWVAPDFRHPWMLKWGYIPCRVMKNISYGQLGATNSRGVHEFFEGNVVFNEDPYQLFYDCQSKMNDMDFILSQMKMVKEKHTYVNRCRSIIEAANES